MALLELRDVHTYYGNIHALKGISITIEQGEIVTLIGSNGAGKSTTLKTISGLLRPREGEVWFDGRLSGWAFTFAQFIAHVARDETVNVGDFFGSGPPAYSVGFEIDRWIKPGDVVECEIEGIGVLSNTIVRA